MNSIEDGAWKITDMERTLFPGGPSAFRVDSPVGVFLFGMSLKPGVAGEDREQTALISGFGEGVEDRQNIFEGDDAARAEALERVCALLTAKGVALKRGGPIVSTEFTEGSDTKMEIF